MFDSSVIREIAGGKAVKCAAVKPLRARRYDGEMRGHFRGETRRKEQDSMVPSVDKRRQECVHIQDVNTRAHTCQSPRSRVPGCLKTANVAAKEVPTGRQRGEVKGRHLKNRIKAKYCFVLKSSGGRSDQIGARSRILSKVKGVIQHKTGCGD